MQNQPPQPIVHRLSQINRKEDEKNGNANGKTGLLLRELEWYEVETRIRQFVYELVDPKLQMMMRDRQKVDNFHSVLDSINDRIRSFDEIFYNNELKMAKYETATGRISEMTSQIENIKVDLQAKSDRLDSMKAKSEEQFTMLRTTTSQMNLQYDRIALNVDQSIQEVDRFRKDMLTLMDAHNVKHNQLQEEVLSFLEKEKEKARRIVLSLDGLYQKLEVKEAADIAKQKFMNKLECDVISNSEQLKQAQNTLIEHSKMQKNLQDLREQSFKLQLSLQNLSHYVDKNVPLNTYSQISECVYSVLSSDKVKTFIEADEKQLKILNSRLSHKYQQLSMLSTPLQQPMPFQFGAVTAAAAASSAQSSATMAELRLNESTQLKQSHDVRGVEQIDCKDSQNFFNEKIAAVVKRNQKAKKTYKNKEMFEKSQQIEDPFNSSNLPGSGSASMSPSNPKMARDDSPDSKKNNGSSNYNNIGGFLLSGSINLGPNPPLIRPLKSLIIDPPLNSGNRQKVARSALSFDFDERYEDGIDSNQKIGINIGDSTTPNGVGTLQMIPQGNLNEVIRQQLNSDDFIYMLDSLVDNRFQKVQTLNTEFEKKIKASINEIEEHNSQTMDNFNEKAQLLQETAQNLQQNLMTAILKNQLMIEELQHEMITVDNRFLPINASIQHLNQISMIVYQLLVQDEKDKQSMGLYGLKDPQQTASDSGMLQAPFNGSTYAQQSFNGSSLKQSQPNSTGIRLEEKCLSCSGQGILLNQYFKLACLAYNPQPLSIDGQEYTRLDLLKVCSKITGQLKQINFERDVGVSSPRITKQTTLSNSSKWLKSPTTMSCDKAASSSTLRPKSSSTHQSQHYPLLSSGLDEMKTLPDEILPAYTYDEKLDDKSIRQSSTAGDWKSRKHLIKSSSVERKANMQFSSSIIGSSNSSFSLQSSDSTAEIPSFLKHKTRKIIAKRSSLLENSSSNNQIQQQPQAKSTTSKDKITTYEKRRQFIMKQYAPPQQSNSSYQLL